jgi:hypothetical protein
MTDIRLDLTVPVLSFGFGVFKVDPIVSLLGCSIEDIVESLLVAPVYRQAFGSGPVDVYPLALPDGEGASIPLGRFGHAGFQNAGGLLVLHLPRALRSVVERRTVGMLEGVVEDVRFDGSPSIRVPLRLRPGMGVRVPLGGLGEVGLHAA